MIILVKHSSLSVDHAIIIDTISIIFDCKRDAVIDEFQYYYFLDDIRNNFNRFYNNFVNNVITIDVLHLKEK